MTGFEADKRDDIKGLSVTLFWSHDHQLPLFTVESTGSLISVEAADKVLHAHKHMYMHARAHTHMHICTHKHT